MSFEDLKTTTLVNLVDGLKGGVLVVRHRSQAFACADPDTLTVRVPELSDLVADLKINDGNDGR